jgi:hypothetical protein
MKRRCLPLLWVVLLAGCATPLPDGSRIARLPADAATSAPALSPQEAQKLAQLNAQVLAEQDAARAREAREEAWRRAQQQMYFDLYYGPGWWGWHDRWGHRHPRWSFGLGWYAPWPY